MDGSLRFRIHSKQPLKCSRCAPDTGKSIAELKRANELSRIGAAELDAGLTPHLDRHERLYRTWA